MFDGLNNKVKNGGLNDQGKLKATEWNAFINELISELNNRIISIVMNGTVYQPINGIIELGSIISAIRYELSVNSEGQLIISYASSSDDFTMAVNNDGELLITY